jgi:glutathione S-transferase
MQLILTHGAPGSVKSTVAKALRERLHSPWFEFARIPEFREKPGRAISFADEYLLSFDSSPVCLWCNHTTAGFFTNHELPPILDFRSGHKQNSRRSHDHMNLYWHPFSIIPWRVRIALREKDIACEEVSVDVFTTKRSADFLRLNPFGQIPVLENGTLVIAESIAILEYLEELHPEPPLMPRDTEARAVARQFMCWSTDYWPPAWKKWMAPRFPGTTWTEESVGEGRAEIAAHLDVLAQHLDTCEWLVDTYSLADICYAPLVLVLDRVGLEDELAARPTVAQWTARLRERPAVQATMMPPAP